MMEPRIRSWARHRRQRNKDAVQVSWAPTNALGQEAGIWFEIHSMRRAISPLLLQTNISKL
eukprot:351893-Chlamydomonas_euryale.AAC.6